MCYQYLWIINVCIIEHMYVPPANIDIIPLLLKHSENIFVEIEMT
jgi:hypothetical protein